MMKKILPILFLFLASCNHLPAVGEDYKKPEIEMPSKWDSLQNDELALEKIEQAWWLNFQDPVLERVIDMAIKNNRNLKIAQSRVLEARANLKAETSKLGPTASASGSASRKNNFVNPATPETHTIFNLFTAGFDALWEFDLFGANRRSRQAAKASFEAAQEEKNYTLISLIAEVVKNYSDLRLAQNQLFFQKRIDASYQEIIALDKEKKEAGLLGEIEFSRIKMALLSSKSDLADAEAKLASALYNLEFLLGKKPGEMRDFFGEMNEVPILRKDLVLDAPASLLLNRPDIRQAERQLQVAVELKGYSIAQIFPKISLSGFFGFYSTQSGELFKKSNNVFSAQAQLSTPILDFGGVIAGMKMAEERKQQALLTYQDAVYKALSDAESSIASFIAEYEKLALNLQSYELSKMLAELDYKRCKEGLISYRDRVYSYIDFLQAEQKLDAAKAEFLVKTVALYKALGGGWEISEKEN